MSTPKLLIISGKKGAGKDTMAPLIIEQLGIQNAVHMSCADPLKDVVDEFISDIRDCDTRAEAVTAVRVVDPDIPDDFARDLVDILYDPVHEDPNEHSRSHSHAAVRALQLYGTEFRRAQDPDYWVRIAVRRAAKAIDANQFPYFTDARFPNEVKGLSGIGGLTIRLDVNPEEQARRLRERDGRLPRPDELSHSSETSLDDYTGFDIRVETDGVDTTLQRIMSALRS